MTFKTQFPVCNVDWQVVNELHEGVTSVLTLKTVTGFL